MMLSDGRKWHEIPKIFVFPCNEKINLGIWFKKCHIWWNKLISKRCPLVFLVVAILIVNVSSRFSLTIFILMYFSSFFSFSFFFTNSLISAQSLYTFQLPVWGFIDYILCLFFRVVFLSEKKAPIFMFSLLPYRKGNIAKQVKWVDLIDLMNSKLDVVNVDFTKSKSIS